MPYASKSKGRRSQCDLSIGQIGRLRIVSDRTAKGKWSGREVIFDTYEDTGVFDFARYAHLARHCEDLQNRVLVVGSEAYISPINSQSPPPAWELSDENNPQEKRRRLDMIKRFEASAK